jgi:signal-transduction protein with cAMP-binding, CBS, and nucleotidyltransferase domain
MSSNNIGSVVIVTNTDSNKDRIPIGIITERDVVKLIGVDPYKSHLSVSELIDKPLITVPPSTSLRYALRLMVSENIRRLPVVENSKLVGIVTDRDIYHEIIRNESLIFALASDELLVKRAEDLQKPWVYKLGEILHKRIDNSIGKSGEHNREKGIN